MNIFKPTEKLKELYQAEHPPDAIVKVVQYSFITCLAIREGVWNRTRGSTKAGRGAHGVFQVGRCCRWFCQAWERGRWATRGPDGHGQPRALAQNPDFSLVGWGGEVVNKPGSPPNQAVLCLSLDVKCLAFLGGDKIHKGTGQKSCVLGA